MSTGPLRRGLDCSLSEPGVNVGQQCASVCVCVCVCVCVLIFGGRVYDHMCGAVLAVASRAVGHHSDTTSCCSDAVIGEWTEFRQTLSWLSV